MEISFLTVLALVAFGLLITVTGGAIYLTAADWRDRRRRDQSIRAERSSSVRVERPTKKR